MDKLLNDIGIYLSRQPYAEVANLIERISVELQNIEMNKKVADKLPKEVVENKEVSEEKKA